MEDIKNYNLNSGKIKTGIKGLDLLLHDGLVLPESGDGLILLIKGKPGTGKTTLALKIANNVSQEIYNNELNKQNPEENNWSFFTCEQRKEDIAAKCMDFGYEIDQSHIFDYDIASDNSYSSDPRYASSQTTLTWANNILLSRFVDDSKVDKVKRQNVIVIDGLNMMGSEERDSINMSWFISTLRKYSVLSILVYEPLEGEPSQIDSMVDMILQLKGEEFNGPPLYYLNKISITKSRFQNYGLGWHQYKIFNNKGLIIFPSIHFYIHKSNFFADELKNSKKNWYKCICKSQDDQKHYLMKNNQSIISKLLDNKQTYGSFTVLLGPRKTCKTLLSIDFLKDGSRNKENGLLVSLIDNRETIINNILHTFSSDTDEEKMNACERNYLFHFRPGCVTSNEFFHYLNEQMNNRPKRFVLWDLPQVDFSYPLISNDSMFFPALIDYLKSSNSGSDESWQNGRSETASVIIGTFSCKLAKSAFTMADNVILLLRDKYENKECIYAYVDRIEGQPGVHYLYRITLNDNQAVTEVGDDFSIGNDIFEDIKEISKTDINFAEKLSHRFERIIYSIENHK